MIDAEASPPSPRRASRLDRRRLLLGGVLIAELAAGTALSRTGGDVIRSENTSTRSTSLAAAPALAPLNLPDGRTAHFLGMGGVVTDAFLRRVAAHLGDATDAVAAFWGTDWQRHIIVVATATAGQFRALTRGPAGTQWVDVAAAAVADTVDPAHRTATGQRIVFAPGARAMSDYTLRIVLRHELFHFASRSQTTLDAPRWLTEGVADFVARPAAARPGGSAAATLGELPTDADFAMSGSALSLTYDRAWWFTRFIAETHGSATLRTLYLHAGCTDHPDPGTTMRDVLQADEADVLADWRHWLMSG
jgi:hypothetical protein